MQQRIVYEFDLNGSPVRIESGEIANHAQSALLVTYGGTSALITVSVGEANPDLDFFPLTVDYVEKFYAGGLISSSPYIKREARPSDHEILSARLIDHAIRSLFPKEFKNETQVISQIISYDKLHDPVLTSIIGVSFAFMYSGLPFLGPYGATKVAYIDGELVFNPSLTELENSLLNMTVSSVEADGIVSVEAEAHDLPDEIIKQGILKAIELNKKLIEEQNNFIKKFGKKEFVFEPVKQETDLYTEISEKVKKDLEIAIYIEEKIPREKAISTIKKQLIEFYEPKIKSEELKINDITAAFEKVIKTIVRYNILTSGKRPDGRDLDTVRPLTMRTGVLPRVHGSALFTRGETQTLSIVTLGSERDAQMLQNLEGEHSKRYFHHYNMPGYANGEVDRKLGFANRRSIGHGDIGERAVVNMIATKEEFPYTIRVVSEVTSSNGSTSMAATCSSTLSLMDAGVPMKKIVGGIGVGLVFESKDNYKILTDIIGYEDFYGDMDFKITGTKEGITAIQLDNKMSGIPEDILFEAIDTSRKARMHVLGEMEKCISESRKDISPYAPKIKQIKIDPEKIGELIGPGGKTIRAITEKSGVEITIDQDNSGNVSIYAANEEQFELAMKMISGAIGDLTEGAEFDAKIVRIEPYGVFVQIPDTNIQGMIHVSNLGLGFVKDINEVVKLDQVLKVKYVGKDEKGRVKFVVVKQTEENL